MSKDIRCTVRLHHYTQTRNDRGEVYYECSRCNKLNLIMGPGDANQPFRGGMPFNAHGGGGFDGGGG